MVLQLQKFKIMLQIDKYDSAILIGIVQYFNEEKMIEHMYTYKANNKC